tara:strand:+ start:8896 stop:9138 length:243 start_codon:yes stop_codon:yes gene_type:complete
MIAGDYAYDKSWEDIHAMLETAEAEKNRHKMIILDENISTRDKAQPMRDYKGLQGVCNALRWVIGDKDMRVDVLLGRDRI